MLLEHNGERPKVHPTAYVAPNATLCRGCAPWQLLQSLSWFRWGGHP